jgi:cytochrome c2
MARAATVFGCILPLLFATHSRAQDVPAYYNEHCAACHTIGGGSQAGPDLKDVTRHRDRDWLVRFLVDPEGLVARGDPTAAALVRQWDGVVMPATPGLTPDVAAALLTYIERQSAGGVAAAPDREVTAADAVRGRDLFTGVRHLQGGGPPCLACHDVASAAPLRGGTLGPDLTASYRRLGAQRGTAGWLQAPPTPMMRAIYRDTPLDDDERHALAALLGGADGATSPARWRGASAIAVAALEGTVLFLALAGFVWRKRFRAVRRPLLAMTRASARAGGPR